jgi:nicotinamidase-related amidase
MQKETKTMALLVMDMQMGILENYPNAGAIVAKVCRATKKARAADIPVIYNKSLPQAG